jgi:sensor histidine kinase YesM
MDFKYRYRSKLIVFVTILFTLFLKKEIYDVNISLWSNAVDTLLIAVCLGIPFFFYDASIIKKLILPSIFFLVMAIYEIITIALTAFLLHKTMEEVRDHRSLLFYVLSILVPVIVLIWLSLIYKRRKFNLTLSADSRIEMYVILISNIVFIAFTAELWKSSADNIISINMIIPTMMSIIIINSVLTMILLYKSYQRAEKQMENNLKMQQIEMENRLNQDMTEVMENLRGLRHDMNTHMGILKGLTEFKQYDELKKYLESIYTDIKISNSYLAIPHPALSILINSKILKASDLNIDFQPMVSFKTIQMDEKDICALIGNLLENAIEACEKVFSEKYIGFTIMEKNNCLLIHCENTFEIMPIRKGESFLTSKKEEQWHGVGIKNIQSIVKRYNGTMDIAVEQMFVADICLPCI